MREPLVLSFVVAMAMMGAGAAAGGTVSLLFPSHPYAVGESVWFRVAYTIIGSSMAFGSVWLLSTTGKDE